MTGKITEMKLWAEKEFAVQIELTTDSKEIFKISPTGAIEKFYLNINKPATSLLMIDYVMWDLIIQESIMWRCRKLPVIGPVIGIIRSLNFRRKLKKRWS